MCYCYALLYLRLTNYLTGISEYNAWSGEKWDDCV